MVASVRSARTKCERLSSVGLAQRGAVKDPSLRKNYETTDNISTRISLHERFSTNEIGWHRWVQGRLPVNTDQRVVELGCGRGDLWTSLDAGFDLLLTDRSPAMLDAARERLGSMQRVHYRLVDLDSIDLDPDSADVVIANHCLYHAADPSQSVASIRSVLRPGGTAIFGTNGRRHMAELDGLLGFNEVRVDARFGLETGVEIARETFDRVDVVRYPDSLHITEAGPLIDYVRSIPGPHDEEALARIQTEVEGEIARFGAFFVGKDAGLIVAS